MAEVRSLLIDSLGPVEREAVVAHLRKREYKRGQVVFNDGDRGDCLHLVQSGHLDVQVTTLVGQTMTLRVVQPGEFFGELALVQPNLRRTGRVSALDAVQTWALHRTDFEDLRRRFFGLDRFLVTALAERVIRTSELAVELLMPAETRLWRRLAILADAYGDQAIQISQDDLARMVGTVRQTVNRALQVGVKRGALALQRNSILVLDRDALERLAS